MIRLFLVVLLSLLAAPALAADGSGPAPDNFLGVVVANLLPAAATLVAAVLSWAIVSVSTWLRKKTKAQWAWALEERVFAAANRAVREVEQTIRPKVALAAADGKVTAEEARELRDEALAAVKHQLGDAWKDLVGLVGGEDRAVAKVTTEIEAAVLDLKADRLVFARSPRPAPVAP